MSLPQDSPPPEVRIPSTPWILAGICAIGFALRIYNLDFQSLWIDELYSMVAVNPVHDLAWIVDYCKSDQPPFYFLTLNYWFQVFPYTAFWGRFFSVVAGMLGIISMYFLGKEIRNSNVGLFAAFLTAVNYFQIYYSQEVRFYSMLFLLSALSFLFFLRALRRERIREYASYALVTSALLYTQYYGMIVLGIQGLLFLVYWWMFRVRPAVILYGLVAGAIIVILFIPWMPTVLADSGISSYWVEKPRIYFPAVYYYIYFGKDVVSGLLLLVLAIAYLFSWIHQTRTNGERWHIYIGLVLITWTTLSYLLPYLRSVLAAPMLLPRYTQITLPSIFVIMALGYDQIKVRRKVLLAPLLLLLLIVNLFFIQKYYARVEKAQWREAAQVVISRYQPGDLAYSNQQWWYDFFFYNTEPRIYVKGS